MANWCSSAYVIVGDVNEVKELYSQMKKLQEMSEPLAENGFGTRWLGNLVAALGGDCEKIDCRGEWDDLELTQDGTVLRFSTETAWSPCNEVFMLVKTKWPSLKYYFTSEEPNEGLYITNDALGEYFSERYVLSGVDPDGNDFYEFFDTLEQVSEYCKRNFDTEIKSVEDIETLDEEWREKNEDAYCNLYEYQID